MASHHYHRFESRCYETASGFQTVWHPLTKETNTFQMRDMTTRHLYFLSRILQDSLLTRRLNQAIAAMIGLSGRCDKVVELFCLAGLEILKNIPHNHQLVLKFYKDMFLACADFQSEILLNFALYLVLQQRNVFEGLELLKSKSNKLQFSQSLMHKAYIGLFEYLLHQPKKIESTVFQGVDTYDSEDENDNIFPQTFPTKSNLDFSLKRSLVLFEEVFSKPGVWDQFIPVYVELLERNVGEIAVRKFLKEYRDKNPLNPNTHRYLYHYLKTKSATEDEKMKVLEDLIKLDPTSEYIEDLVELKTKSDKASIVRILFEKLDHVVCMYDYQSWTQLESFLDTGCSNESDVGCNVISQSDVKHELQLCWKQRESWWPKYHFRLRRNFQFSDELKTVMLCKARVAEYFLGIGNAFSGEIHRKYGITNSNERNDETVIKDLSDKRTPLKRCTSNNDTDSEKTKRRKR